MVPTTEGGFTALREGMVFDPFSGQIDATGRAVFSSGGQLNTIPQSRLNAATTRLLNLVPLPNLEGDTNNYFNSGTHVRQASHVRMEVTVGDPSEVILQTGRMHNAELIVTGTHGLGGFRKLLLGSTTEQVLRRTECPVLAVPVGAAPPECQGVPAWVARPGVTNNAS